MQSTNLGDAKDFGMEITYDNPDGFVIILFIAYEKMILNFIR